MKRDIKLLIGLFLNLLLLVLSLNFISAQGELSEVLAQVDQGVVLLSAVFMITFSFVFFSLKKIIFKDDETIAGIIAAMLALVNYLMN